MSASDRVPLLRAILTTPDDDLPRLVYADWLDEFGSGDLDAATSEFIRASCNSTGKKRMPAAAYTWLKENWKRLVPAFVARNDNHAMSGRTWAWGADVRGRRVGTVMILPYRYDNTDRCFYSVNFEFSRGFLHKAVLFAVRGFQRIVPLVRDDQPLVTFPSYFAYMNSIGAKRRYSMNPLDDLKAY